LSVANIKESENETREKMESRNLSVAEAAIYMGVKERFIRRLIAEHRISFLKLGKHIRIPEKAIIEFETMSFVEKVN